MLHPKMPTPILEVDGGGEIRDIVEENQKD